MIKIEVKNLNELIKKFWAINVNKSLTTWVKKTIIFLEGESKRLTPVVKNILRTSYKSEFSNGWIEWKLINYRGYWIFVHEWTRFIKWNPFMTKAVEKSTRQINVIWNGEINKLLKTLQI